MTVVGIVSEYNPLHSGHVYQYECIRREFGEDTAIVAIMSGNFTQRGEPAILPKSYRARAAVMSGANLVIELPFPYSASSAEIFASSAVSIAESLGFIDHLSFGSECGDISELIGAAEIIDSAGFHNAFSALSSNKSMGYPEKYEAAYKACSGAALDFSPNNILAIEYIRALRRTGTKIRPHTVKRSGAGYTASDISEGMHPSAMAIRRAIAGGESDLSNLLPEGSFSAIRDALGVGDFPIDEERLSSAVISNLRLSPDSTDTEYHDASDGLYNRLRSASFEANDISSLLSLTAAKNYTNARIRRAMWNVFLGVTSSDVKNAPMYTQVLALDAVGMQLLKSTRKRDGFRVLTKPSDTKDFSREALGQKLLSDKADSVYELAKPLPKSGKSSLRFTPFVKK